MLASPARALSRALLAAAARPSAIESARTSTRAMATSTTATAGGLPVEVR